MSEDNKRIWIEVYADDVMDVDGSMIHDGIILSNTGLEPIIWQFRKKGDEKWTTPSPNANPSNPAYRERWSNEYDFRPTPKSIDPHKAGE